MEPRTKRSASKFAGRPFSSATTEGDMVRSPLRYSDRKQFSIIFFNPVLFGLRCWKNRPSVHSRVDAQAVDELTRFFVHASFSTGYYKTKPATFVFSLN